MSLAAKGRDTSKAVRAAIKALKGKPAHNKKAIILNNNKKFNSLTEAANQLNCSISLISNNLIGLSKITKFGIWTYQ